ncbi:MAG: ThiF family adenylyltransferase [Burkholderiales bacterium]|nr:ThiF family adenylyltransferase [Burkholderiales bacterium]
MANAAPPTSLARGGQGNIGAQVVPLLAGLTALESVLLIDFDCYERANLGFQRIAARDVGRPKATVQAAILRRLRPGLSVTAQVCRFEHVPLGALRRSIVLSCVDSRAARQSINRAAFALGVPWIDAALSRDGSVRARAFVPGRGACLECAWGPRDYELLEQRLPCTAAGAAPASTAAALELGSIAAGLQVALCRRLIDGAHAAGALADRQWFLDVPSGCGWTGTYVSNPACRLDHEPWDVTELGKGSVDLPLAEALALGGPDIDRSSLAPPGMAFVRRLRCPWCGALRRVHWRLCGRMSSRLCPVCAAPLRAAALDTQMRLGTANAPAAVLREPLAHRGFVPGDIVALEAAGTTRRFLLS